MLIIYSFLITATGAALCADIGDAIVSMLRKPKSY